MELTYANSWEIVPHYPRARHEDATSKGGSHQKYVILKEGSLEECEAFLEEFYNYMRGDKHDDFIEIDA